MRLRWVPAALHTHRKLQLPLNTVLGGIMVKLFFLKSLLPDNGHWNG